GENGAWPRINIVCFLETLLSANIRNTKFNKVDFLSCLCDIKGNMLDCTLKDRNRLKYLNSWHRIFYSNFMLKLGDQSECAYDYVEIFDGPSLSSPFISKLCGAGLSQMVNTTKNSMTLRFISDYGIQNRGFEATYWFGEWKIIVYIYLGKIHSAILKISFLTVSAPM
ncbi:unnamed protein product, partial [Schistocephalus solidus]|uniref:CUB domain-containing protein n=1 Tax=Schistocephalus solidus TaxID=70667 RepID=A0A183TEC7_SCHSO